MPRALGQIDIRKHEAILNAAMEVLAERGIHAPIEEVARRAGVSKQTVYNHYGSKTELVRTLVARRRAVITAPLERPGAGRRPQDALAAYAQTILEMITTPASAQIWRMAVTSAIDMPELSRTIYETSAKTSRARLAAFLSESCADELSIPDPLAAAEMFLGMVISGVQLRMALGLDPEIVAQDIPARAKECAVRFMRAFARGP